MKYAIIEDGVVSNLAIADVPLSDNWIEATDDAVIGGTWDGKAFGPIPAPDAAEALAAWRASASIPRAEFVINCVAAGILDEADAERAATGEWPAAFDGFLAGMDLAGRIRARAEWKDNARIRRKAPTLLALQDVAKLTDEQVDRLIGWKP